MMEQEVTIVVVYHLCWQAMVGQDMGERCRLLGVRSSSSTIEVQIYPRRSFGIGSMVEMIEDVV